MKVTSRKTKFKTKFVRAKANEDDKNLDFIEHPPRTVKLIGEGECPTCRTPLIFYEEIVEGYKGTVTP